MKEYHKEFGRLFTKYRLKAQFLTLYQFGHALADEGLLYEDSIFSRWQKGNRVPRQRKVVLTMLSVFVKHGGITTIREANEFMEASKQGYLTEKEEQEMFHKPMSEVNPMHTPQTFLIESNTTLSDLEQYVYTLKDFTYRGFASFAYRKLGELIDQIKELKLDKTQQGKNLISNIMWQRITAYANSAKVTEFGEGLKEAYEARDYARENNTPYQGPATWMIPHIARLALLADKEEKFSKQQVLEVLTSSEEASHLMTNETFEEKISSHLEASLICLILRDKARFDEHIAVAIALIEKAPNPPAPFVSLVWNAKARAGMRFGESEDTILSYVSLGKKYLDPKYQTVHLYLNNTKLQALTTSQDPVYQKEAERLAEQVRLQAKLLGNKYQSFKINNKRLIGV